MTTKAQERMALARTAPLCGAKARTTGEPCKRLARRGSGRCRYHGGRSTGPKSAVALDALKKRMTKHGWFAREARDARKEQRAALRALKAAARKMAQR